jgi:hypothetical protein
MARRIGIIGTGVVGKTLCAGLHGQRHYVMLGSRDATKANGLGLGRFRHGRRTSGARHRATVPTLVHPRPARGALDTRPQIATRLIGDGELMTLEPCLVTL